MSKKDFQNNSVISYLKKLTKVNNDVYLIANKSKLGITLSLESFMKELGFYKKFKQITIEWDNEETICKVVQLIEKFPLELEYNFKVQTQNFMRHLVELFRLLMNVKSLSISWDWLKITMLKHWSKSEISLVDYRFFVENDKIKEYKIMSFTDLMKKS